MANPFDFLPDDENLPSWAQEIHSDLRNRSPASYGATQSGLLSEDEIYEMSKLPKPFEDEIQRQNDLIKSYRDADVKDSVQLVPLYNKLGELRAKQKQALEEKYSKPKTYPDYSAKSKPIEPSGNFGFNKPKDDLSDIIPSSDSSAKFPNYLMSDNTNTANQPKDDLSDVIPASQNSTELPDYLMPGKYNNTNTLNEPDTTAMAASDVMPSKPSKASVSSKQKGSAETSQETEPQSDLAKAGIFVPPTGDYTKRLLDTQSEANKLRAYERIMQGINQIGSSVSGAISGYSVTPGKVGGLSEVADQMMEDFKSQMAMEQDDPNSAYSKGFRDFAIPIAAKIGIKPESLAALSGKQLGAVIPEMRQIYENKLMGEYRRQALAESRAERAERQAERANEKNERQIKTLYYGWKSKLPTLGGPAATVNRNRVNQADAIFATFNLDRDATEDDINKLDNNQLRNYGRMMVNESAIELNKLLSGSSAPSQKTLEKLVPKNIYMDYVQLKDYFSSKLNPAEQADFIKQVLKVAVRVRDKSQAQLTDVYKKDAAGRSAFWNNPEIGPDFDATLRASGLKDEQIQEIKNPQSKSGESTSGQQSTSKSSYFPGDIVSIQGKKYRVLEDGDSLEEVK